MTKLPAMGNEAFAYEARLYEKIAVVRWIALVPHGQRVMGSNPITVIGGVRWGIRPQFPRCSSDNPVP